MSTTAPSRPKLPVFATVRRAYAAAVSNFATFVRIAWLWIVLILLVNFAILALLPERLAPTTPAGYVRFGVTDWAVLQAIGFLNALLVIPMLSSIAVNWHRMLLAGERPGPMAFIRFDAPVWAYTGLAIIFSLIKTLVGFPQLAASVNSAGGASPLAPFFQIAAALVFLAGLMYLARYSVALPAKALENGAIGPRRAFQATRGNTWRISWGFVLCFMPLIALGVASYWIWPGPAVMLSASPTATAIRLINGALAAIAGIVGVGFLSYTYLHFFPSAPRPAA